MVSDYLAFYTGEHKRLGHLLNHLRISEDILDRKVEPGHVTASGIVIRNDKILSVFHPFLEKWLQPGGHVEAGEWPIQAAEREVYEEAGVQVMLHPWHHTHRIPFDIDIHSIPSNPQRQELRHLHYDFRYIFLCKFEAGVLFGGEHVCEWKSAATIAEPHLQILISKLICVGALSK